MVAARGRQQSKRSASSSSSSSSGSSSCSYTSSRRSRGRGSDDSTSRSDNNGWNLAVALECGKHTKTVITRVRMSDIGIHMKEDPRHSGKQLCTVVANLVIDKQSASRTTSHEFDNPTVVAQSSWHATANSAHTVGMNLTVSKREKWLSHHHICSIIVGKYGGKVLLQADYVGQKPVLHNRPKNKSDEDWSISLARPHNVESATGKVAIRMIEASLKLLDPTDGETEPCRRLCAVNVTFSISQQSRRTSRNTPTRGTQKKGRHIERMTALSKTWQGEELENLVGVDLKTKNGADCSPICTISITCDGSAIQLNAPMAPQGEQRQTTKKLTNQLLKDRSVWSQLTTRDLVHMYNRKIQVTEANDSWSRLPTHTRSNRTVKFAATIARKRRKTSMDMAMLKTKHRNTLPVNIRNGLQSDTAYSLWQNTRLSWQKLADMSRLDPQLVTSLISERGSYVGSIEDDDMAVVKKRSSGRPSKSPSGSPTRVRKGGVNKRQKKKRQPPRKSSNRRKQ